MSGKRSNPVDYPPTASSSDEEEASSMGEGEEYSSSDEEQDVASSKKQEPALTAKKQVSDSESGSEDESDSDSEPAKKAKPEPAAKPVTKTKDPVVKKQDSKKAKTSEKSASKKRPSESAEAADAKKVKRVSGEEEKKSSTEETVKKNPFQRKWSEEDEIAVLQGFIDYTNENKVSPYDDTNAFYQSVKESINFEFSKIQFMEKVRGLKKKFETKGKNGEEPIFSKPHDRKAFELSKLIWGADGIAPDSGVKSSGKPRKSASKLKKVVSKEELVSSLLNGNKKEEETTKGEEVVSYLVKSLPRFGVDDLAAQQGWSRLSAEDKKRFEEKWEALQVKELEMHSEKNGFVHEVVGKMAEAFQSNP